VRFEASKDTGKDEDAGRTLVEAMSDLARLQLGEEEADKRLAALIEEHTRGALRRSPCWTAMFITKKDLTIEQYLLCTCSCL
jgi:hypothetical protein